MINFNYLNSFSDTILITLTFYITYTGVKNWSWTNKMI